MNAAHAIIIRAAVCDTHAHARRSVLFWLLFRRVRLLRPASAAAYSMYLPLAHHPAMGPGTQSTWNPNGTRTGT
jgi:hypothetical protein